MRNEADLRRAQVVAVGFRKSAVMFHLRLASPPIAVRELADVVGPLIVVAPRATRARIESAIGPCLAVAEPTSSGGSGGISLVALATKSP